MLSHFFGRKTISCKREDQEGKRHEQRNKLKRELEEAPPITSNRCAMLMRTALDTNLRSESKVGVNSVNESDMFD